MSKLPWYALLIALLVVLGFGWLCFYMIDAAASLPKDEQFRWDHIVVVFNALQTMAAAALGVLLGTTVQQSRVDAAQLHAANAQAKADANADDAAKAKAAKHIISGLQAPGAAANSDATLRAITAALN